MCAEEEDPYWRRFSFIVLGFAILVIVSYICYHEFGIFVLGLPRQQPVLEKHLQLEKIPNCFYLVCILLDINLISFYCFLGSFGSQYALLGTRRFLLEAGLLHLTLDFVNIKSHFFKLHFILCFDTPQRGGTKLILPGGEVSFLSLSSGFLTNS